MFSAAFEYHRAASLKEALTLLKRFGDDGKLLGGGHSLLPMMKMRLVQPAHIIDIGRICELGGIREDGGRIVIGAGTTHHAVETSDLMRSRLPVLAQCAATIGDVQVRNRGTIGGSLAHADPAADYPAAVLALEAELKLESEAGTRSVAAADFFLGLMTTAVRSGEILTQVSIAALPARTGSCYLKHRQPASGFALVGVAAIVTLDAKGSCEGVRVGITGLGPKAFRALAVESALNGKPPEPAAVSAAAAHAADGVDVLSDIHASADFRAELARVYTRRALEQAVARATA